MRFVKILLILLLPSHAIHAQLSLIAPQICHDKDNYLRCFNDGRNLLTFEKGNFKEFRTADTRFVYSDIEKKISVILETTFGQTIFDTVHILLLEKSILLKRDTISYEITSLQSFPQKMEDDYGLIPVFEDSFFRHFRIAMNGEWEILVNISRFGKTWSWDLKSVNNTDRFAINFRVFNQARLEHIIIQDKKSDQGMMLTTTRKSNKKIAELFSSKMEKVHRLPDSVQSITRFRTGEIYHFKYDGSGRLKNGQSKQAPDYCKCDIPPIKE